MHPSSSSRRPQPPQAASQAAPDRPAPLPLKLEVFTRGTVIPAPLSEQQQEQVLQRRLKKHGAPTSAELGTRTTNATTALSSLPVAPENPMLSAVSDDTLGKQEKGGLQLLSSANSIAEPTAPPLPTKPSGVNSPSAAPLEPATPISPDRQNSQEPSHASPSRLSGLRTSLTSLAVRLGLSPERPPPPP